MKVLQQDNKLMVLVSLSALPAGALCEERAPVPTVHPCLCDQGWGHTMSLLCLVPGASFCSQGTWNVCGGNPEGLTWAF